MFFFAAHLFTHHIIAQQVSEWCALGKKSTQMKVVFKIDPSISNSFVFSKLQLVCYRRGCTSNLRNDKQRSLCPAWHIADGRLLLQVSLRLCLSCLWVCVLFPTIWYCTMEHCHWVHIMDILYLSTTYLGSVFTLQQLHFHWGHNDTTVIAISNFDAQRASDWLAFFHFGTEQGRAN